MSFKCVVQYVPAQYILLVQRGITPIRCSCQGAAQKAPYPSYVLPPPGVRETKNSRPLPRINETWKMAACMHVSACGMVQGIRKHGFKDLDQKATSWSAHASIAMNVLLLVQLQDLT